MPAPKIASSVHVPRAAANPVDVLVLWTSLLRWVLQSRTDFASFLHIYLRDPLSAEESTALPFWRIPAPYPELLRAEAACDGSGRAPMCRKLRPREKL